MKLTSIKNLIYASSSSVYGSNENVPFQESDKTNNGFLFMRTKKTNEILAETYSNLYALKCVGLRFFQFTSHLEDLIWHTTNFPVC